MASVVIAPGTMTSDGYAAMASAFGTVLVVSTIVSAPSTTRAASANVTLIQWHPSPASATAMPSVTWVTFTGYATGTTVSTASAQSMCSPCVPPVVRHALLPRDHHRAVLLLQCIASLKKG